MKRKYGTWTLVTLLGTSLLVSGCGKELPPKQALETAYANASNMKSTDFDLSMSMSLDMPQDVLDNDPGMAAVANMLKNFEVKAKGTYQMDPMQAEMTVEAQLKGDMQMNISLPLVMTQEKMWVKVPNIPMLPIPKDVVGKFIELDMKELSEQSGGTFNTDAANIQKQQQLGQELMKVVVTSFDENTFLSKLDAKAYKLADQSQPKQVVKFAVTNENLEAAVNTVIEKVAPQVLDLLASDKYAGVAQLTKEEVEEAKKELAAQDKSELKQGLDEMKKELQINELSVITGIDKKDFPALMELNADIGFTQDNQPIKAGIKATTTYSRINEPAEFKLGIPKDTITLEELESKMNGY
ncbi:DUF6612 family protein [Paenibacillus caseinilyticus]|uniref:Lipoprotein n=1 Tax=Paenibacillus mucilaginosus K02 TaxID=997761 RepID=I0BTD6_9BACL|nr:DUF6612 family protein [Paenibacillus mucilaginosus]AFH65633.1 hypothetical protein B2K_33880 [Paenibacillus mucilaginosus K02]